MNNFFPLITALKRPRSAIVFLVTGLAFFSLNYYALANLPASRDFMCLLGGNLTPFNLFFAGLISMAIALVFAGLLELGHRKMVKNSLRIGSASGVGILTGALASFCTICTLPIISLFGIGAFLAFVSEHQTVFKAMSLVILMVALYFLNAQLRKDCKFCRK